MERDANGAHLTPGARAEILGRLENSSPNQIMAAAGFSPSAIFTLDSCFSLGFGTCLGLGTVSLIGCVGVAAAAGALTDGVLAGPGCVLGGLAAADIYEFGASQGTVQNVQSDTFTQWAQSQILQASSDWNQTDGAYRNIAAALNFSLVAFERMADNAALQQIGNSSFNSAQDLFQSGIAAQMSSIGETFSQQWAAPYAILEEWSNAQFGTGSTLSTTGAKFCPPSFDGGASCIRPNGANPSVTYVGDWFGNGCSTPQGSGNTTYYLPPNTTYIVSQVTAGAPANLLVHPVLGTGWTTVTPVNSTYGYLSSGTWYTDWYYKYAFNAGYYQLSRASGTFLGMGAPGMACFPSADNTAITGINPEGVASVQTAGSISSTPYNSSGGGYSSATSSVYYTVGGSAVTYAPTPLGLTTAQDFAKWLGHIEFQAAANAQTYWSFLRALGYTSVGQIPINCIIPQPWMVLPSQLNLGNLTPTELNSLFYAWVKGMGVFYNNTNLTTTKFCGNSKQLAWTVNNTIWSNFAVNSTGYLYLNNGTSPITVNSTRLSTEKFGNLSTWAVTKRQLLLMPTLASIAIPLGTIWEVPANDPVEVFIPSLNQLVILYGNGSYPFTPEFVPTGGVSDVVAQASSSPGSAVYLTSCTTYGTATSNCTVTIQTIKTVVTNLTCLGGAQNPASCQTQVVSGGTGGGFGIGNPFQALVNWLASLFGGGPLSALVSSILSVLIPVAVIGLVVYIAVVELEAWGNSKSQGSSGSNSRGVGGFRRRKSGRRSLLRSREGSAHVSALMIFGFLMMGVGFLIALLDGVVNLTGPALLVFGLVVVALGIVADTYGAETRKR